MTRRIILWIKVAVAVILLGIMFHVIRPETIWAALKSARYELVAIGALLMPLNIWLQEYKWRYLVRLVRPEAKFWETTGSLLGGFAFGVVTPGRLGEYARALFIRDTPPLKLVGLTVIDKFYNLGCTAAFGLPALLTLPWALDLMKMNGSLLVSLLILLGVGDLVLLYFALDPRPVRSLIYAAQIMVPKGDKIARLFGGLDRFGAPQALVTLLMTVAHYLVFLAQFYVLICSFTRLDPITSSRGAAAILFSKSALPIAIGDLGLDQMVSVQFFSQFGVQAEAAFNASMLLFAINVLVPALLGLLFMGRLQLGGSKNRKGQAG